MSDAEITAEMVLEVTPVRREVAERIAAYANRRVAGLSRGKASRECGFTDRTGSNYEKVVAQLCRQHGLPAPPKGREVPAPHYESLAAQSARGAHQRHHVLRGVVNPACPLCQDGATS